MAGTLSKRKRSECICHGCDKQARDKSGHCKGHGGGRRCSAAGCEKSGQGSTDYCKGHGGGTRCSTAGCDKSARGTTNHCIGHGGGNRCVVCADVSVHFKDGACYRCRSGTSLKQWESYSTKWLEKLGWTSSSHARAECRRETDHASSARTTYSSSKPTWCPRDRRVIPSALRSPVRGRPNGQDKRRCKAAAPSRALQSGQVPVPEARGSPEKPIC